MNTLYVLEISLVKIKTVKCVRWNIIRRYDFVELINFQIIPRAVHTYTWLPSVKFALAIRSNTTDLETTLLKEKNTTRVSYEVSNLPRASFSRIRIFANGSTGLLGMRNFQTKPVYISPPNLHNYATPAAITYQTSQPPKTPVIFGYPMHHLYKTFASSPSHNTRYQGTSKQLSAVSQRILQSSAGTHAFRVRLSSTRCACPQRNRYALYTARETKTVHPSARTR